MDGAGPASGEPTPRGEANESRDAEAAPANQQQDAGLAVANGESLLQGSSNEGRRSCGSANENTEPQEATNYCKEPQPTNEASRLKSPTNEDAGAAATANEDSTNQAPPNPDTPPQDPTNDLVDLPAAANEAPDPWDWSLEEAWLRAPDEEGLDECWAEPEGWEAEPDEDDDDDDDEAEEGSERWWPSPDGAWAKLIVRPGRGLDRPGPGSLCRVRLTFPGSGQSLTIPGSGQSLTSPGSGQSLTISSSGQSVTVPPSGQSLPIPVSDQSLPVPGSGQSLTVPPSGQSLTIPNSDHSLPIPPSSQSLTGPPSGQSLTDPPSSQSLTDPPSSQSLTDPPSGQSLTDPPSSQSLTIPGSGHSLTLPSSSQSLPVPPWGRWLTICLGTAEGRWACALDAALETMTRGELARLRPAGATAPLTVRLGRFTPAPPFWDAPPARRWLRVGSGHARATALLSRGLLRPAGLAYSRALRAAIAAGGPAPLSPDAAALKAELHAGLALVQLRLGLPAAAADNAGRALALRPAHLEARYRRGVAQAAMRDLEAAMADLGAVLRAQPGHAGARRELRRVRGAARERDARLARRLGRLFA